MAQYRIYCLDAGGKISFAEELDAANDKEAIAKTRALKRRALKCEVWKGTKLVATLDTQDLAD
jgi:hypothetical protein